MWKLSSEKKARVLFVHTSLASMHTKGDSTLRLYVFFWVFPRRPIVVCRRFGTLYHFHLQGLDVEYEV